MHDCFDHHIERGYSKEVYGDIVNGAERKLTLTLKRSTCTSPDAYGLVIPPLEQLPARQTARHSGNGRPVVRRGAVTIAYGDITIATAAVNEYSVNVPNRCLAPSATVKGSQYQLDESVQCQVENESAAADVVTSQTSRWLTEWCDSCRSCGWNGF